MGMSMYDENFQLKIRIRHEAERIRGQLSLSNEWSRFLGEYSNIPDVFIGSERTELIIIGQDPTTGSEGTHGPCNVVFCIDRNHNIKSFLEREICSPIGRSFDRQVYATNLIKCFLWEPPATAIRKDRSLVPLLSEPWLPLLREEVDRFPGVPIVTLGDPALWMLCIRVGCELKEFWGHRGEGRTDHGEMSFVQSNESRLGRPFFPFPHIKTNLIPFYAENFKHYAEFMRDAIQ
jgi:uracil-DNA glycosylase